MSFLKALFGGGKRESVAAEPTETARIDHAGFVIRATPYRTGGEYQTAGVIEKTVGGEAKSHRFVRAEKHGSVEGATDFSLMKGRQIVDQLGDGLFD
mgnify:CR=1 FL=1|jgi:Uncharacterized conserved protein